MSLKQFLKPDWRKIVVFFAIIILEFVMISIYFSSFSYSAAFDPYEECCLNQSYPTHCPESWNMSECSIIKETREIEYNHTRTTFILALISVMVVNYFLSCLIVWIYDKFRKPKKFGKVYKLSKHISQK